MRGRGRPFHVTATGAVGNAGTPCTLLVLNVNKAVAGGTATLYNGASAAGAVIGIVALDVARSFIFDAFCDAGLWIVLAGASPDLTATVS